MVAVLTLLAVVMAVAVIPFLTMAVVALLALAVGLRSRVRAPRRRRRGSRTSPPLWPREPPTAPDATAPTWTRTWPMAPPRDELSTVRQGVSALLSEWNISGEAAQPTLLVITELLANAIEHGSAPIHVTLRLTPPVVLVQVHDGAPHAPQQQSHDPGRLRGYGLHLIEELAAHRGWFPEPDGKTVWAEVPLGWPTPPPSG